MTKTYVGAQPEPLAMRENLCVETYDSDFD